MDGTAGMTPEQAEELGRRFGEAAGIAIAEQVRKAMGEMGGTTSGTNSEWRGGAPNEIQVQDLLGKAREGGGDEGVDKADLLEQVLQSLVDIQASVDQMVSFMSDDSGL